MLVGVWSVLIAWGAIGRECAGSQDWFRGAGALGAVVFAAMFCAVLSCAATLDVESVGRETSGREKRTGAAGFAAEERIGVVRRFMKASCAEKVGIFRREESGWFGF